MSHHAHTIHSLDELIEYCTQYNSGGEIKAEPEGPRRDKFVRNARRRWKRHIEKNGNVPMVLKCAVCSGTEFKNDIKHGRFSPRRPSKRLREEMKGNEI